MNRMKNPRLVTILTKVTNATQENQKQLCEGLHEFYVAKQNNLKIYPQQYLDLTLASVTR